MQNSFTATESMNSNKTHIRLPITP